MRQDYATALLWFQKAIDAGSSDAMSNLTTMYLRGMGVPPDLSNAVIDAYAWLLVAEQSTMPDELGITVLARIEKLASASRRSGVTKRGSSPSDVSRC